MKLPRQIEQTTYPGPNLAAWLPALVCASLLAVNGGTALAQTLNIVNNFSQVQGGSYFGSNIESEDIYIYFTGTNVSAITYNAGTNVVAQQGIQLSTVTGGQFTLGSTVVGARAYALLGSNQTASISPSGPSPITTGNPYSYIEFTTASGGQGDQSFIDQVSFPTKFSNGSATNSWAPATTPQSVTGAFNAAFPAAPYAPAAGVVPGSGTPYEPSSPITVNRTVGAPVSATRIIGPKSINVPNLSPSLEGTGYSNAPGFNDYLGWLQTNQPAEGWKIGYNSNDTALDPLSVHVGYLTVTGTSGNYGLTMGNFTFGGNFSSGNITGGTTSNGTITFAPNNSQQSIYGGNATGNWTDQVLFSAADPLSIVTLTGDLVGDDVSSILYTVSGAIGAGILGSDLYLSNGSNTDYFFTEGGFTNTNALTDFFDNSTFGNATQSGFYDQYWYTMLNQAGGLDGGVLAGYFTPYADHFNGLDPLVATDSGTLTWELGIVPEPRALALLAIAAAAFGVCRLRRSVRI